MTGLGKCAARLTALSLVLGAGGCLGVDYAVGPGTEYITSEIGPYFAGMGAALVVGAVIQPPAYIEGTHQPLTVVATPPSATCDVIQGDELVGTIHRGSGKVALAKSTKHLTVTCGAIGYKSKSVELHSSVLPYGLLRCFTDGFCFPAARNDELRQYPTRVEMSLASLRPPAARQIAALETRRAAEVAPPPPAETPAETGSVSTGGLPALPPSVRALRAGAEKKEAPPAPDDALDAPLGAWRTTTDGTKAWWGRETPNSIAMPPTALLALQRTNGDWGLFDYRGKDGRRGRVWIALDDVRLAN